MQREKKTQRHRFKSTIAEIKKAPTWRTERNKRRLESSEEGSSSRKRSETGEERDNIILSNFYNEVERRILKKIQDCKKVEGDQQQLYQTQSSITKLERGVVTEAEKSANYDATNIEKCLKRQNSKEKIKTVDRWNSYVKDNFQRLLLKSVDISPNAPEEALSVPAIPNKNNVIRTCSTNLDKIIRDIEMKEHVIKVLDDAIKDSSDYVIEYSLLVLLFNGHSFDTNEMNEITFIERKRFNITSILPDDYKVDSSLFMASYIPQRALESDDFNKQFSKLFKNDHFNYIHSEFFGSRGTSEATLEKFKCHKLLIEKLSDEPQSLPCQSLVINIAKTTFATNFKNMWVSKKKTNKLLDKLLEILLRIHLTPNRERTLKQYIKDRATKNEKKKKAENAKNIMKFIKMLYWVKQFSPA